MKNGYQDTIVYEINIRNFSAEGTFRAVISRLTYLKSLGINMIWLMPVHPVGEIKRKGTFGSPYSVKDFYNVNPDFGTKRDFSDLVEQIHRQEIAVIMDLVTNHTAWDHDWITQHPAWYIRDSNGRIQAPNAEWTDVAQLNYSNGDLREEMSSMMKYWITEFDADGYRCDMAELVPLDFWKNSIAELRKLKPVFMLAESENDSMYQAGFDATYGFEMYHGLKKVWNGERATILPEIYSAEQKKFSASFLPLRFITNHDEYSWQQIPQKMYGNEDGALAAFVFLLSLNGLPLIFNGQENGFPENMNLFEKYTISQDINFPLTARYRKLLMSYHQSDGFCNGEIQWLSGSDDALIFLKRKNENRLLFVFNVHPKPSIIFIPDAFVGMQARDLFSDTSFILSKNVHLSAFEFHILQVT